MRITDQELANALEQMEGFDMRDPILAQCKAAMTAMGKDLQEARRDSKKAQETIYKMALELNNRENTITRQAEEIRKLVWSPDVALMRRAYALINQGVLSDDGMDGDIGLKWIKETETHHPEFALHKDAAAGKDEET